MVGSKSVKTKRVETKLKKENKSESQKVAHATSLKPSENDQKTVKSSFRKHEKRKKSANALNQTLQRDILEKMFGNNDRPGQNMSLVRKELIENPVIVSKSTAKTSSGIKHSDTKVANSEAFSKGSSNKTPRKNADHPKIIIEESSKIDIKNDSWENVTKTKSLSSKAQALKKIKNKNKKKQKINGIIHLPPGHSLDLPSNKSDDSGTSQESPTGRKLNISNIEEQKQTALKLTIGSKSSPTESHSQQSLTAESNKIAKAFQEFRDLQSFQNFKMSYENSRERSGKYKGMENHSRTDEHLDRYSSSTNRMGGMHRPPQSHPSMAGGLFRGERMAPKVTHSSHMAYGGGNLTQPNNTSNYNQRGLHFVSSPFEMPYNASSPIHKCSGRNEQHKLITSNMQKKDTCGDFQHRNNWNSSFADRAMLFSNASILNPTPRLPLGFENTHYRNITSARGYGVNLARDGQLYKSYGSSGYQSGPRTPKDFRCTNSEAPIQSQGREQPPRNQYTNGKLLSQTKSELWYEKRSAVTHGSTHGDKVNEVLLNGKYNHVEKMKQLLLNVSYNSSGHSIGNHSYAENLPIFRKTPLSPHDLMGNLQKSRTTSNIFESATNRSSHSSRHDYFLNDNKQEDSTGGSNNNIRYMANSPYYMEKLREAELQNRSSYSISSTASLDSNREVDRHHKFGNALGSIYAAEKKSEINGNRLNGISKPFIYIGAGEKRCDGGANSHRSSSQVKENKDEKYREGSVGKCSDSSNSKLSIGKAISSTSSGKESSGSFNSTTKSFEKNRESDAGFYSSETSPPSSCGLRIHSNSARTSADRKDSQTNLTSNAIKSNNGEDTVKEKNGSSHTISSNCSDRATSGSSSKSPTNSFEATGGASSSESSSDEQSSKRRNRRFKRRPMRRQRNEQQALISYINSMVCKYLGDENKEKAERLCFNGGISNLEGYAKRLVREEIGQIVEEKIRIYRRNNRLSFITISNGKPQTYDACITMRVARRYALEGDVVRAFVLHPKESPPLSARLSSEDFFEEEEEEYDEEDEPLFRNDEEEEPFATMPDQCPKAFVIKVVNPISPRYTVGVIRFERQRRMCGVQYYILRPEDTRVPLVYVPQIWCNIFLENPKIKESKNYFFAEILETNSSGHCIGKILKHIGFVGDKDAELQAILANNGLHHVKPFDQQSNKMYSNGDLHMNKPEHFKFEDCRNLCVFSIDPENAQDIDDALSLEVKNPDKIVVGVHIADVSRYVCENSELDKIVRQRATSIYLPNQVIHMLPDSLCEKCSLLPGKDRFVLTVRFVFDSKGEQICEPVIARCLVRSCAKLTYDHVQKIIEIGAEGRQVQDYDLPYLYGFHRKHIIGRVLLLNSLAQFLRQRRFLNGALSINNPKYFFDFDDNNGEPYNFYPEVRQESNFLIEEFMLLANEAVARFIHSHFPDTSILRTHNPPLMRPLQALRERLSNHGLQLDLASAGTIYESMRRICSETNDPDAMDALLSNWLTRPMVRALYICSEGKSIDDLKHYALAITMYTHFTSPIRRYADIMVHRLVSAALKIGPTPRRPPEELHAQADLCNKLKFNAKSAADDALTMMFKRLVKAKGFLRMRSVVIEIFRRSLDVLLIDTGHVIKIYYDQQNVQIDTRTLPNYITAFQISTHYKVKINVFCVLEIEVALNDGKLQGFLLVNRPKQLLR